MLRAISSMEVPESAKAQIAPKRRSNSAAASVKVSEGVEARLGTAIKTGPSLEAACRRSSRLRFGSPGVIEGVRPGATPVSSWASRSLIERT